MEWAEKYRPEHLADIVGNTSSVRQIAEWARTWNTRSKPLLMYGKPGIGKTSSAYALGYDMKWDIIELNASDQRTAAVIERVAGEGSATASLTGSLRKLIVMDEADNLQGTADRGGAKAIIECIKNARQPIILIANDLYGIAPELRLRCEPVQFKALPSRSIAPRLKFICASEKIACSEEAVHEIAESAGGDMRSAVNMLYASALGRTSLTGEQVHTSQKDSRVSIFSLVTAVFSNVPDEKLMSIARDVDEIPEVVEQWVEGSVHTLADPRAMGRAYSSLARADEYIGNTYRRQYHTLWRYATALMLLGVADASGGKGIHTRILPPERWQKMSTAKKQKAIRNAVLLRFASSMQLPQTTLREKYLDIITLLVELDPETFAREMALDAEGLTFFLNDKARAQEIVKSVTKTEREKETEQKKKSKKTKTDETGEEQNLPLKKTTPEEKPEINPAPVPESPDKKLKSNQSTLF
jgi:replication factor C large subunit